MPNDDRTDSQRIRRIQSLCLQLDDLITTSARQRSALDALFREVQALREKIDEERQRLQVRASGANKK
jgi:hypothetical protein